LTEELPQIGNKVIGTIVDVKGKCTPGHKVGDTFNLSLHSADGLCGSFYHMIFPDIVLLQFGGQRPWGDPDVIVRECIDRVNAVKIRLERAK
jgi:uncharacterized repeat protein (TIGR04076 family)